jgi:hypothetical protein
MKKSYVAETSLRIHVEIDLGEVAQLIQVLEPAAEEGSNDWTAKELKRKLETLRREAVEEASREFSRLATQS